MPQHLRFEFDLRKAASNLRKHGVSFDEAIASFYDTSSRNWPEADHSGLEMSDSSTSEEQLHFDSSTWFIMKRTV